ncbi:MAG: nucleoside-diphosphate sugar epimerase/dehydratase, partial [Bacteroidales bacterium]|nr:nucleoside-diphosphate sugar epimerase/dehydratase [Bacteroidales bacterium]
LCLSVAATVLAYLFVILLFRVDPNRYLLIRIMIASAIISGILLYSFQIHKDIIRHLSTFVIIKLIIISFLKSALLVAVVFAFWDDYYSYTVFSGVFDLLVTAFFLVCVRVGMVGAYYFIINSKTTHKSNALLYSTTATNLSIVTQLNNDPDSKYRIKGFLSTNKTKQGMLIFGQMIYYVNQSPEELKTLFTNLKIESVIFPSIAKFEQQKGNLVEFCIDNGVHMFISGELIDSDKVDGINKVEIKPIQIEDLLGRQEITVDIENISEEICGKSVMVTGAAGSIGSELCRQVASYGVRLLILYDNAETPLHNIQLELENSFPSVDIKYVLADVRSEQRAKAIIDRYKPSIIFHAAAYKHVPMIEANPCEGVLTNVHGTLNMAKRAMENGVRKFVMISTDKAVNPTNVMGATKRIAEMCIQSLNQYGKTEFITTRFGNVLGSNGSVIPLFKEQIAKGGPVTVTHPDIIRYFMTIPEACRLVLQAATMGHAGEILVFDMGEQVRIVDLARKMITLSGLKPDGDIKIEFTGLRPGEKLYEELLSSKENTIETNHEKIRIAKAEKVDINAFRKNVYELIDYALVVNIDATVKLMKSICKEYKSNNSEFEKFDGCGVK